MVKLLEDLWLVFIIKNYGFMIFSQMKLCELWIWTVSIIVDCLELISQRHFNVMKIIISWKMNNVIFTSLFYDLRFENIRRVDSDSSGI